MESGILLRKASDLQRNILQHNIVDQSINVLCSPWGKQKTSVILDLLSQNSNGYVGWIHSNKLPFYPLALQQYKIDSKRILFIDSSKTKSITTPSATTAWCIEESLRSGIFSFLIIDCHESDQYTDLMLRRIQIATKHHQCCTVFLCTPYSLVAQRLEHSWMIANFIKY